MKRIWQWVLPISLLLLSACGGRGEQQALEQIRESWRQAETLRFDAEITAQLSGGEVFDCAFTGEKDRQELSMTFTAPELARGIGLRQAAGETFLHCEGVEVAVGDLSGTNIAPAELLPLLLEHMLEGFVTDVYRERDGHEDLLCARIYVDEDSEILLRLDGRGCPRQAELRQQGHVVGQCRWLSFTQEGDTEDEATDHEDLGGDQSGEHR